MYVVQVTRYLNKILNNVITAVGIFTCSTKQFLPDCFIVTRHTHLKDPPQPPRCHAPLSNLFFCFFVLPRSSIVSELESLVPVICLLSSQPILRVVTRGAWRLQSPPFSMSSEFIDKHYLHCEAKSRCFTVNCVLKSMFIIAKLSLGPLEDFTVKTAHATNVLNFVRL